jgi:hypothetical protein
MATIKEKIAAANKARDAAAMSAEDAAALADNEALLRAQEEQADAEAKQRAASLIRRLFAAQEIHGVSKVKAVAISGSEHTYIVKGNQPAHGTWEARLQKSLVDPKKHPKSEYERDYAVASVVDWNGETDFSDRNDAGYRLIKHLTENGGQCGPIVNAAMKLNGFIAEEAKS